MGKDTAVRVKVFVHLNVPLLETALNPIKVGRIEVISSTLRDILGVVNGNLLQDVGGDNIPLFADIASGHCEPNASEETMFERRSILVDPQSLNEVHGSASLDQS